jgi:hypothetical protein
MDSMTNVKIDDIFPLTHVFSKVVPTTFVGGLFLLVVFYELEN